MHREGDVVEGLESGEGLGHLVSLEERKLSVPRTLLLTGGIVAVVGAAAGLALRSGADPQPGNVTPEPPPITRIPIFRFHF